VRLEEKPCLFVIESPWGGWLDNQYEDRILYPDLESAQRYVDELNAGSDLTPYKVVPLYREFKGVQS
jgi:hypothetical protein